MTEVDVAVIGGGVTGLAAPNVVPLTQLFTVAAVTCAEEPPVTTVVVRICSTPLNVPVNVATSQPVLGLSQPKPPGGLPWTHPAVAGGVKLPPMWR